MRARSNGDSDNEEVFSAVNHYLDKAIKDMNNKKKISKWTLIYDISKFLF